MKKILAYWLPIGIGLFAVLIALGMFADVLAFVSGRR
jgi:hypothetical protein